MDKLKNNDYVKFNSEHFDLQNGEYVVGYVEKVNVKPNNHKKKCEYYDFFILDYKLNTKKLQNTVCLKNCEQRGFDLITDPIEISKLEKLKTLNHNG